MFSIKFLLVSTFIAGAMFGAWLALANSSWSAIAVPLLFVLLILFFAVSFPRPIQTALVTIAVNLSLIAVSVALIWLDPNGGRANAGFMHSLNYFGYPTVVGEFTSSLPRPLNGICFLLLPILCWGTAAFLLAMISRRTWNSSRPV